MPNRVVILGAGGGFGKLFVDLFFQCGDVVYGVDRQPYAAPESGGALKRFELIDLLSPVESRALPFVEMADIVISCAPETVTASALDQLTPRMKAGALFADILSVKTSICERMERGRSDLEFISLHPMFAPSVGFANQNVAFVGIRPGPNAARLRDLLDGWGANIVETTATEHDEVMAVVQVATHFAILCFGSALTALSYDVARAIPLASPPHRLLLCLVDRVANGNPDVYWQIQAANPNAERIRMVCEESVHSMHRILRAGDSERFEEALTMMRLSIGNAHKQLAALAALAFPLAVRSGSETPV